MRARTQTRTQPQARPVHDAPVPGGALDGRSPRPANRVEPAVQVAWERRREAARRRRETGRAGEALVARYLTDAGWLVLDRNWRPGTGLRGELDLVALEAPGQDGGPPVLVAVEVKTRTSTAMGEPAAAVGPAKVSRLRALAVAWAADHEMRPARLRVDVVSVLAEPGRTPVLRHHRGVGL